MKLDELRQLVRAVDPGVLLVSRRLINRIWKAEFHVPYLLVEAPHDRCYFFDRQTLFKHVDQDELELEADRLLPAKVIVLVKPTAEELQSYEREALLLKYWRLLFHARLHVALHEQRQEGRLTDQEIRQRITTLGPTVFREIKSVLHQEKYLLPPEDDLQTYCEFVTVYQELRYFRSNLRTTYFPSLPDLLMIDRLVDEGLDAAALFRETRLPGAPDPVVRTDTSSDESHDFYWRLVHQAEKLAKDSNTVRAAIVRTKAARVAPAALTESTRESAVAELQRLTQRMQVALKLTNEQAAAWLQVLPALLDKADQGNWPDEAKLLYDLQQACVEFEKKTFSVDLVDWAFSLGRRPIKRPLPGLQLVHITKHLRNAAKRLTLARIADTTRQRFAKLLQEALEQSEERVRERFRPVLNDAFHDVGLVANNPPEEVALRKMVEELLDRLNEYGFITFSDLRDCVARNQLKMPDLLDPHSFWRGDPLVRLDRRLAAMMDGVYRRGEMYLRWLERSSSLLFGTGTGRLLTLHLLLPMGVPLVLFWATEETLASKGLHSLGEKATWVSAVVTGVFLWALMHLPSFRHACTRGLVLFWRGLRAVCVDLPRWLREIPLLQRMLHSWPYLLLHWYLIKPLIFTALVWLVWVMGTSDVPRSSTGISWPFGGWEKSLLVFVLVNVIVNSRFGLLLTEAYTEAFALAYHWLRFDFLRGLFRWTLYVFKQLNDGVEYVLYSVDEWLRFRSGESELTLALRAVLGVLWYPIGYFTRLYYLLFIESNLNPFKLAISILAAKVVYPLLFLFVNFPTSQQIASMNFWEYLLFLFASFSLYMSPGICAFLVWEVMNNWRLFRANRSTRLKPVALGKHGETVAQYLKPGFHSGTVPRLYGQLRRAERRAYRTGQWRPARTARQGLKEVAHSLQVFIEREFLTLLQLSPTWGQQPVRVARVELSSTHFQIELTHMDHPAEPLHLQVEERAGWILCGVPETGWLVHMNDLQRHVFASALAGLYKIIGADFIREQLQSTLGVNADGYDFSSSRLLVRSGDAMAPLEYPLRRRRDLLLPIAGTDAMPGPALEASALFYARLPLTWEQWVECWRRDGLGLSPAQLPLSRNWQLLPEAQVNSSKGIPRADSSPLQPETVRFREETVHPLRSDDPAWLPLPAVNGEAQHAPIGPLEQSPPAPPAESNAQGQLPSASLE